MNRSDREVQDTATIREFLQNNNVLRLALTSEDAPYIVPLSYGFDYNEEEGSLVFYFHGAKHGLKIDLAKKNPNVGFEIDNVVKLTRSEIACGFSFKYESIIGKGKLQFFDDPLEKNYCLNRIMHNLTSKDNWEYNGEVLKKTIAFKLTVDSFTMKKS